MMNFKPRIGSTFTLRASSDMRGMKMRSMPSVCRVAVKPICQQNHCATGMGFWNTRVSIIKLLKIELDKERLGSRLHSELNTFALTDFNMVSELVFRAFCHY